MRSYKLISAIEEFASGVQGFHQPNSNVVHIATRITEAAFERTIQPEITVDVDGALSFDLRLHNGQLVLAELEPDGSLDASIYDSQSTLIKRLPHTTETILVNML